MHAPQPDTERACGPYRILRGRSAPGGSAAVRCLLAREERSGRVHTLMLPPDGSSHDPAYAVRFRAEAENSRRLAGPWFAPVTAVSLPGAEPPWVAYDCFPALPLPAALAVHGGPLPAATVRALGAALAEALAQAHANGMVHAGVCPASVLLTPYGPRLTGYGLVRSAAVDGADRSEAPGIDASTLPPEQRSGGRPRPHGDVYALGAVLAYAVTGRTGADPAELPEELRAPLAACLAQDPAQRPQPADLARQLASVAETRGLPLSVSQELEAQIAAHPVVPGAGQETAGADGETATARPLHGLRSRRALVTALATGAAGLAIGGGAAAVARAVGVGAQAPRTPLYRRGSAPAPLWRYDLGDGEAVGIRALGRERIALTASDTYVAAVDLRTGKELWKRDDLLAFGDMLLLDDGTVAMPEYDALAFFSLRTGRILWREKGRDGTEGLEQGPLVRADGKTLWYVLKGAGDGEFDSDKQTLAAYDVGRRKETWRSPLPKLFFPDDFDVEALLTKEALLLPSNSDEQEYGDPKFWRVFHRAGGKPGRTYLFQGWDDYDCTTLLVSGDLMVYSMKSSLRARDLRSDTQRWKLALDGTTTDAAFAVHGHMLYVTDDAGITHAVDIRRGERRWRSRARRHFRAEAGTAVSHSGRTVVQAYGGETEALDAADGTVRWRLALTGQGTAAAGEATLLGPAPGMMTVVQGKALYALPVD
ncbi:PQQ-binding-like beta-propeller repeat protein [Streptomyces sp. NPDC053560]|uniref:outer membrane protein assembly factor BamB family protein n=1 Tax=Streptomyces sp. NPDC053560 TaxID=3365711 RepID=UPI0037D74593